MPDRKLTAEEIRLAEANDRKVHWKRWGPYVAERAWGTVREDYSPFGTAWDYFPHDHARSRAYRWNEDGIAGICDRHQQICFSVALWNGQDAILKERIFGLTGSEGNHGEDPKEYYFYTDCTPTHSYMSYLYKYPQAAFPYTQILEENRRRSRQEPEFELMDTGVFNEDRYFDVNVEYAKAGSEDILIKVTVSNRGSEDATLRLLPTVWFRNTWSWHHNRPRPILSVGPEVQGNTSISVHHHRYGQRWLYCEGKPGLLFCDNETNTKHLYDVDGPLYPKDGINDHVVNGADTVNPEKKGTKASADYSLKIGAGASVTVKLRLTNEDWQSKGNPLDASFDQIFSQRMTEADEFYATVIPDDLSGDAKSVMRQAFAGMLWSKQYYHYVQHEWIDGDPTQPRPPQERRTGRNREWAHIFNADVISMPDKWEYPWYAAWDLAFHTVTLALIDPDFAKEQLVLMTREWYMHPNGQLPAYEWAFGDVNPPVHAWAAWRIYKIEKKRRGVADREFLKRVFHKLMLNFTWWVNRKDTNGHNIFQGGFLGLDNIGVFDRSAPLPTGGYIEQSDGTSWMAMYTLNLLAIAIELAKEDPTYEDVASKFWEHFLYIAHAMSHIGHSEDTLWDDDDGFYYDVLHLPNGQRTPMKVRSMVGLIPLFAVETIEPEMLQRMPGFARRMQWFLDNRQDLTSNTACMETPGHHEHRLLSIVDASDLRRILKYMLDENEFFSPFGIRAISKVHRDHPYVLQVNGHEHSVHYEPGESQTGVFGGNSNWRGPIWMPVNYLLVEALQKFHHYYGPEFKVECPTGSGKMMTLWEVAAELSHRLNSIFLMDEQGRRPVNGGIEKFDKDPHWRDLVLFYEYFHGDTGRGVGANHQTGWTGLVAKMLQQSGERKSSKQKPKSAISQSRKAAVAKV